jgi:hypothetical protein
MTLLARSASSGQRTPSDPRGSAHGEAGPRRECPGIASGGRVSFAGRVLRLVRAGRIHRLWAQPPADGAGGTRRREATLVSGAAYAAHAVRTDQARAQVPCACNDGKVRRTAFRAGGRASGVPVRLAEHIDQRSHERA